MLSGAEPSIHISLHNARDATDSDKIPWGNEEQVSHYKGEDDEDENPNSQKGGKEQVSQDLALIDSTVHTQGPCRGPDTPRLAHR